MVVPMEFNLRLIVVNLSQIKNNFMKYQTPLEIFES